MNIKYIIIYTGYDSRLTEIQMNMNISCNWTEKQTLSWESITSEYDIVYLPPLTYHEGEDNMSDPFVANNDQYEEVRSLLIGSKHQRYIDDAACFKISTGQDDLYDILHDVDYCGCFGTIDSIYLAGNGSILIYHMDCESG